MTEPQSHKLKVTFVGEPEDARDAFIAAARALASVYANVVVPGTFTVHHLASDPTKAMLETAITWDTKLPMEARPDFVPVVISLPGRLWNYVGETLAYGAAKHEWASVEDTIVAVLTDIMDSDRETPER